MFFCPTCGNLLLVEARALSASSTVQMHCNTCAYVQRVGEPIARALPTTRKKVDDVLGGAKAWEAAEQTTIACANPDCDGTRAYFFLMQTRSADEPMTQFNKCVKCGKQWSI